jgi:hypothetical protein
MWQCCLWHLASARVQIPPRNRVWPGGCLDPDAIVCLS